MNKKVTRRLSLSTETVRKLNNNELSAVAGGMLTSQEAAMGKGCPRCSTSSYVIGPSKCIDECVE
jgi:hypothetical protein